MAPDDDAGGSTWEKDARLTPGMPADLIRTVAMFLVLATPVMKSWPLSDRSSPSWPEGPIVADLVRADQVAARPTK